MDNIVWDKLPQKKQSELTNKVKRMSQRFDCIDYAKAAHTNFITKGRLHGAGYAGRPPVTAWNVRRSGKNFYGNVAA